MAAIHSSIAWTASIISYLVIVGFFAFLLILVWLYKSVDTSKSPNEFIISVNHIAVGALTPAFATVVNFWLGSSAGSQNKTNDPVDPGGPTNCGITLKELEG